MDAKIKMKIGILTFHFGNNYGGILQCYATQQLLIKMGHNVEIINYRPSAISFFSRVVNKLKTIRNLSVLLKVLMDFVTVKQCNKQKSGELSIQKAKILSAFDNFRRDYLILTEAVDNTSIGFLCEKFDAIIVGSDQVWTSLYDRNSVYFLDWFPQYQGKRIAYAACSAHSFVTEARRKILSDYLKRFDIISVRDIITQTLVKQIIDEEVDIVADPTLLYNFDEFVSTENVQPYILTYILGSEIKGGHDGALQKVKAQYGNICVKSIIIPGGTSDIVKYSDEQYFDLTPSEWVNMFAHATFVYTDSFHGIMFSIKFKKPFVGYYANQIRSSRLIDLKERFNMTNIVEDMTRIDGDKLYMQEVSVGVSGFLSRSNKLFKDSICV